MFAAFCRAISEPISVAIFAEKMYNGRMKNEGKSPDLALYRRYRSRNLDEILGQPQVTDILKATKKRDVFAHAYLFVGQRGTGKTSVARILAHLITGTDYDAADFDIVEIDAASHGSVDDARELREHADVAPLKSRAKVYIIDEVHMLSRQAFDALLKLIEEPPAHLYFILATTELAKVPPTILSRVQRFTFRPVAEKTVAAHLRDIADREKIDISDDALSLIARRGEGSFRDSITLLDQMKSAGEKISRAFVEESLGLAPRDATAAIFADLEDGDVAQLVAHLAQLFGDGFTASDLSRQLASEISSRWAADPSLFSLVDELLEVAKSADPKLKLTAALAKFADEKARRSARKNGENPSENSAKSDEKLEKSSENSVENSDEKASPKIVEARVTAAKTAATKVFSSEKKHEKRAEKMEILREKDGKNVRSSDENSAKVATKSLEKTDKNTEKIDENDARNLKNLREKVTRKPDERGEKAPENSTEKTRENSAGNAKKSGEKSDESPQNSTENPLEKTSENPREMTKETSPTDENLADFDWSEVLKSFATLDEPAALAIVKNADVRLAGATLTLFFAKNFWRKKASTRHFRDILERAFRETYDATVEIEVSPDPVPGDSAAANVLDLIGGEIVSAE